VLLKMLTLAPAAAKPESEDARRVLTFFMSTLANRQLSKPVALVSGCRAQGALD
jgi:callose synthase